MAGASVSLWSPQSFCEAKGILWDSPSTRIAPSQFLGFSSLDGPIFALGLSVTVQSIAAENNFKPMQPYIMYVLSLCNLRLPTLKSNIKYNFYG